MPERFMEKTKEEYEMMLTLLIETMKKEIVEVHIRKSLCSPRIFYIQKKYLFVHSIPVRIFVISSFFTRLCTTTKLRQNF